MGGSQSTQADTLFLFQNTPSKCKGICTVDAEFLAKYQKHRDRMAALEAKLEAGHAHGRALLDQVKQEPGKDAHALRAYHKHAQSQAKLREQITDAYIKYLLQLTSDPQYISIAKHVAACLRKSCPGFWPRYLKLATAVWNDAAGTEFMDDLRKRHPHAFKNKPQLPGETTHGKLAAAQAALLRKLNAALDLHLKTDPRLKPMLTQMLLGKQKHK